MNHFIMNSNLEIYGAKWTRYYIRNRRTKEKQVFILREENLFDELNILWTNI